MGDDVPTLNVGYLPWMGEGVPISDRRMGYLPWMGWGRYLPWMGRVPTLDRGRGYLPWTVKSTFDGGEGTYLGWGEEYLPWMGEGTYPGWGKGVPTSDRERGSPTLDRLYRRWYTSYCFPQQDFLVYLKLRLVLYSRKY